MAVFVVQDHKTTKQGKGQEPGLASVAVVQAGKAVILLPLATHGSWDMVIPSRTRKVLIMCRARVSAVRSSDRRATLSSRVGTGSHRLGRLVPWQPQSGQEHAQGVEPATRIGQGGQESGVGACDHVYSMRAAMGPVRI